jgi:uncharacterized damage-inducible protein DinB
MAPTSSSLPDALMLSWDRSHRVLMNLVGALPPGGLEARAAADSPSVSQMLMHLHHERMVSLTEEAPEFAGEVPEQEWAPESDPERILALLAGSAERVRDAVRSRIEAGRLTDLNYDHPLLFLQLMMFHDAYHHGQIKLALKLAGCALPDITAGPLTWDVWRMRRR